MGVCVWGDRASWERPRRCGRLGRAAVWSATRTPGIANRTCNRKGEASFCLVSHEPGSNAGSSQGQPLDTVGQRGCQHNFPLARRSALRGVNPIPRMMPGRRKPALTALNGVALGCKPPRLVGRSRGSGGLAPHGLVRAHGGRMVEPIRARVQRLALLQGRSLGRRTRREGRPPSTRTTAGPIRHGPSEARFVASRTFRGPGAGRLPWTIPMVQFPPGPLWAAWMQPTLSAGRPARQGQPLNTCPRRKTR